VGVPDRCSPAEYPRLGGESRRLRSGLVSGACMNPPIKALGVSRGIGSTEQGNPVAYAQGLYEAWQQGNPVAYAQGLVSGACIRGLYQGLVSGACMNLPSERPPPPYGPQIGSRRLKPVQPLLAILRRARLTALASALARRSSTR